MRHVLRFALVAIIALAPGSALADPIATLVVGDTTYRIPTFVGRDKKPFQIGTESIGVVVPWHLKVEGQFEVTLSGVLDPDPSIAYALTVVDFGAPTTFTFSFFTPIVATGSPNVVAATISGTLTDATGNGVSITPDASGFVQRSAVGVPATTSMGVDVGSSATHPGTTPSGPLTYGYGAYNAGPIAGPGLGPWMGLGVVVSFTLSGGDDQAALTGSASINEVSVPEPATLALMLLGAAAVVRRRSRPTV